MELAILSLTLVVALVCFLVVILGIYGIYLLHIWNKESVNRDEEIEKQTARLKGSADSLKRAVDENQIDR